MPSINQSKNFVWHKGREQADGGFALIAALMAIWILTALGLLVFTVTTQDVRISSRTVGEKKAFYAAESGIAWLTQNFNPIDLSASAVSNVVVDAATDPDTQYTIPAPSIPSSGPAAVHYPGFSMGGGEMWGQSRFVGNVTGTNARYSSNVQVGVGVGYGPVDVSTVYR
jgi:Tfp pilus assembly protein PilX